MFPIQVPTNSSLVGHTGALRYLRSAHTLITSLVAAVKFLARRSRLRKDILAHSLRALGGDKTAEAHG